MNNLMSKQIDFKGKKVSTLDSREVAEMLGKEHSEVLKEIEGRKDNKNVGIIPTLEKGNFHLSNYFIPSTYKAGTREYKCYLVTKMGCELLGNKQQGEKGILFTAKYVEAFNKMEEHIKGQAKPTCIEDVLISSLQEMKAMREEVQVIKRGQEETKEQLQGIRDVVALTPNAWRKDTASLISKIAMKLGGFDHIKDVREESYKLLNETYKVDVKRRLLNKQKNMALEGASKSKINKLNYLDVIAEDEKLINGYLGIISKMAIKYGAV